MKLVRRTAQQEKYWRAAAWLLERRNPQEYGRRASYAYTGDQVLELFERFVYAIMPEVREDRREAVMEHLDDTLQEVEARYQRTATLSVNWGVNPTDGDSLPPPADARETASAADLYRLELECPADAAARARWLAGRSQEEIHKLLLRAYLRHDGGKGEGWAEELSTALDECIRRRGGNSVSKTFQRLREKID